MLLNKPHLYKQGNEVLPAGSTVGSLKEETRRGRRYGKYDDNKPFEEWEKLIEDTAKSAFHSNYSCYVFRNI